MEIPVETESYTFEEALARLESVVRELESGKIPLEKALELFEKGIALSGICSEQLKEAERRINLLIAGEKGELVPDSAGIKKDE
ncbi:MAG: Exodeoxyribonuclease 7 small subunit [Desulfotomaculum sp. 46_80]|nr:MAG: Exodeoxyribonuclease 7 small subunit [Desulfotomaculum sp. 46_80]